MMFFEQGFLPVCLQNLVNKVTKLSSKLNICVPLQQAKHQPYKINVNMTVIQIKLYTFLVILYCS